MAPMVSGLFGWLHLIEREISFMDHRSHMAAIKVGNCTKSAGPSPHALILHVCSLHAFNILLWLSWRFHEMNLSLHGGSALLASPLRPLQSFSSTQLLTKLAESPSVGGLRRFHTQKAQQIHLANAWCIQASSSGWVPFCGKALKSIYPLS